MKELMRACSGVSAMWRGSRMIGLPRVYVGECAGIRSVGRSGERWIDAVKDRLRKRGLDVRQAMDMNS